MSYKLPFFLSGKSSVFFPTCITGRLFVLIGNKLPNVLNIVVLSSHSLPKQSPFQEDIPEKFLSPKERILPPDIYFVAGKCGQANQTGGPAWSSQ
jgi:hypothetical protein